MLIRNSKLLTPSDRLLTLEIISMNKIQKIEKYKDLSLLYSLSSMDNLSSKFPSIFNIICNGTY